MAPFAAGILVAGCALFLVCGFRIFARVFQWMAANFFRPRQHAAWDPARLILGLQLGETLRWEISGVFAGVILATVAIRILSPM